jgi:hypothetical protein
LVDREEIASLGWFEKGLEASVSSISWRIACNENQGEGPDKIKYGHEFTRFSKTL